MNGLETGDWVLFGAAAYLAIVTLVRLMIRHRTRVAAQLSAEIARQRQAKIAEDQRLKEQEREKEKEKQQTQAA